MRLSPAWVSQTLLQFEADVIPENDPVVDRLEPLFGEHTYFLAPNGLNIVEPFSADDVGAFFGRVVNLASWSDDSAASLVPHEPVVTELVIRLVGDENKSAGH